MNQYKSKHWREFREKKLQLDRFTCSKCGRKREGGATLQVHHVVYFAGRRPWEYDFVDCITLCKGCHADEHGLRLPLSGWDQVNFEDLGGLDGECEICGNELRYVFTLFHPQWPAIEVGCDCCDRLTQTHVASDLRKCEIKRNQRRDNFLQSPRWSANEDRHVYSYRNTDIIIVNTGGYFRIIMPHAEGKILFPSVDSAKDKIFEIKESGELDAFLARYQTLCVR